MIQKMFDCTRSGTTKNSSHVASVYDKDFLELVWENGEVVVRSSSNRTRNSNEEKTHADGSITKRTRFNPLHSLEDHFPPQRDSDMSSSHQSYGQDSCQSSQNKNSCKIHEEFADLLKPVKHSKPVITTGNTHLQQQQQQQCLPSSPLKKQKTDSTQTPPGAINTRNSGLDQRTTKVNFSNFSIPAVFLKSTTCQGNSATHQTKNDASSQERVVEEIKSATESHGFQKQTSLTVERSRKPPPPVDEHSENVGRNISTHRSQSQQLCCDQNLSSEATRAKGKANTNTCHEPWIASSSACSLGASNDPNFGIRKQEDTDDSTYLSDNDGEPEDIEKQTTEIEGNRAKRSRNAVVHNLSEKKRREKINKRMHTLKALIPNCNKVDKASMLDDAIDYLKTLKLQLQIMSMGSGLWPLMMLPAAAAHHMNGPHLPQLVGGMGFRPPPQLPIPPLSAMTDNRLNMFGFPNQIPPMPMPHAPFFPIIPNSVTQPHLPTTTTPTTNNMVEHFSMLLPNNLGPHENAATKQVPNQVVFQHHNTSCTPPLPNTPFIFPQK